MTNYGLRSYGIDLVGGISGQTSQALVVGLMSPTALGLYTVAMSVSRMLTMFEDSVITVLLPKSAARSLDEIIVLTRRSVGISTLLTAICATIVMVLGPVLLRLLYGTEFLGAIPVFRILLVEIVLQTTTGVLVQTFMATGKPEAIASLQLLTLCFKALLMFLLIPQYQLIGAGLALVISSILRLIFTIASYPLLLKVNPLKLILTREDWLFLLQTFKLIKRR
ncbi:MAG: oligosaccharide flippase family protein [Leptolyngbyaceae cyanobacterium SL_7_1]|nr:oligosaccharide flippase family protein [Leptolyngbyaceae cyanobacterium SL_7_1]